MSASATGTGTGAGGLAGGDRVDNSKTPAPLSEMRVNYSAKAGLGEKDVGNDPVSLFSQWLADAQGTSENEPNAMCLSTADARGRPSGRMVLLKGYDARGFVWYTNYESRKAVELEQNPYASLTFWWASLERSVRIEGPVSRVSDAESDAYFSSRPAQSRIGALVSEQSKPASSRDVLEERWMKLQGEYLDENGDLRKDVQRPKYWGGFRLQPLRFEFWKGRSARLHDRFEFVREDVQCDWSKQRLQP